MLQSKNKKFKKQDFIKGLKIIFKYLKVYKKDLIILSVLAIFSAIANGVVPYLAGRLFDAILSPSKVFDGATFEMPLFLFLIIIWGAVKLIADLVDWRSGIRNEKLSNIVHADYITKGFAKLLELPVSFHKQKRIGEIRERLDRASSGLSQIGGVFVEIAPQFLSIIIALLITFFIKPILASLLIAGIEAYILILARIVQP
ncbi:MAG: ABC transporter transmembrane domain-containing protein, partial [Patescibacteria group bacterium]